MGTYTTNYNLFMPSIGEQGWGDLVNGNFTTIDTTMAELNTRMGIAEGNITSLTTRMGTAETTITSNTSRIVTLETETAAVKEIVTVLEPLSVIQVDSNKNVTFPAKILMLQTDTIYLPLKTSGTVKVFEVPAITHSLQSSSTGWASETKSFTVGEPIFRTNNTDAMKITVSYSSGGSIAPMQGGIRYYENGVLMHTSIGTDTSNQFSTSFDIQLKYGATYKFEFYASGDISSMYKLNHSLSTTALSHYIY